jgi:poly-D-alanine transfer protein DltD
VAASGITSLEIAQNLAALGPEIKGKKVVISFTPSMFTSTAVAEKYYAGDFSRLHANEMVFNPYISFGLKQRIAFRMLDYPDTFVDDPVLEFALQNLASRSHFKFLLYNLSAPVGRLQIQVIRLQDHWEILHWIYSHPKALQPVLRKTYSINWKSEISRARILQDEITSSNPYGIENSRWFTTYRGRFGKKAAPGSGNQDFIQTVSASKPFAP